MLKAIINDNWYQEHPENILGEAYTTSGRFGMVTKYRGDFSALTRIQAPEYVAADMLAPHISSEHDDTTPATITADRQSNIERALRQAPKERSAREQANDGEVDLITFDEIDQLYNAHLSEAEKQAFVWYQTAVLGRRMEGGWEKYKRPGLSKTEVPKEWTQDGVVYWFGAGFLPAFIYLSGNIAERRKQLSADEQIIRTYGDAVFDRQVAAIEARWQEVLTRRQRLDEEKFEDRLIIKPVSDLAKTYVISSLKGDVKFQAKQRRNGQIDFTNKMRSGWAQELKKPVNLQAAFVLWMAANIRQIDFRRGLTYVDIAEMYLQNRKRRKDEDPIEFKKRKSEAEQEGIRLFSEFLAKAITDEDREAIEGLWNERYNSEVPIDLNKVPIGFSMARFYSGIEMDIRPEKREAVAFAQITGTGCLAYGVGLGKTWCAIFIIAQFLENGWCRRPFLVLPNQVYKQFAGECKGILPHIPQNDLFNLSATYLEGLTETKTIYTERGEEVRPDRVLQDEKGQLYYLKDGVRAIISAEEVKFAKELPEGSVTFLTYEGFKRMGVDTYGETDFFFELSQILDQDDENQSKADAARRKEKIEGIIGRGQQGARININDLGLDMMIIDEAHSAKKVFTTVKGSEEENLGDSKTIRRYEITAGEPSAMGIKTFMMSQYIQKSNRTGNVLLLTATPFTNSPMEIYSMTAICAYSYLKEIGLANLKDFFDQFVKSSIELVFTVALKPEFRDIFVGFNNLPGLQGIIRRFFLYKQSTKNLKRPNKIVLPLKEKVVNGVPLKLSPNETVETVVPFTPWQKQILDDILSFAQGQVPLGQVCPNKSLDEETATTGVRLLLSASLARNLSFSPFLVKCDEDTADPGGYKNFIETSAKLTFVMRCVQSVKQWHEANGSPVSGQIIYSNLGVDFFPLIRDYLVQEVGFKTHEVGIIVSESRMQAMGYKDKRTVQNAFLGRRYNPETREYEDIPHEYRLKVLIGSATIREGINLQRYATVLYNLDLPWNPTDVNQLEGRLWRQGNVFKNVRIVNPLMEDSMDIFMFQKLEEKTERINAIWDFAGNARTLDTKEFDPAELKYVLIKDPYRVAELEARERQVELQDKESYLRAQINTLKEFTSAKYAVFTRRDALVKMLSFFKEVSEADKQDPNALKRLVDQVVRNPKPLNGKPFDGIVQELRERSRYSYGYSYSSPYEEYWINSSGITPPWWYSDWKKQLATYNQAVKDVLEKRGLDDSDEAVQKAVDELEAELKQVKETQQEVFEEEKLRERAAQIELDKAAKGIQPASIEQRISEFARLNYLLEDRRVDDQPPAAGAGEPYYRKGETVGYADGKARVLDVVRKNVAQPMYLVKQGKYEELVLQAELSPESAEQKKRIEKIAATAAPPAPAPVATPPAPAPPPPPAAPGQVTPPVPAVAAQARLRLVKARLALKLKLLQLQAAAA